VARYIIERNYEKILVQEERSSFTMKLYRFRHLHTLLRRLPPQVNRPYLKETRPLMVKEIELPTVRSQRTAKPGLTIEGGLSLNLGFFVHNS
jgi:hypothetical protein